MKRSARTNGNGYTILEQTSLVELKLEWAEAIAFGREHRCHATSLQSATSEVQSAMATFGRQHAPAVVSLMVMTVVNVVLLERWR